MTPWLTISAAVAILAGMATQSLAGECGKVVVSGNYEYAPITWRDADAPDTLRGIGVDIIAMALKDTGIPVEGRFVGSWKRTQIEARGGNVDMLTGLYMNAERKEYLQYLSPAFLTDPTAIFVLKGQDFPFKGKEDLVGLSGGAGIGNSFGQDFDDFAAKNLSIEWVPSVDLAMKKLASGRSRYVISGLYAGLDAANKLPGQIEALPHTLASEGVYVAISKQSPCLKYAPLIEQKLREYVDGKVFDRFLNEYLSRSLGAERLP